MKIIGVIPARYESTRLPGKPLADICGKPMILWVYGAVSKAKGIDECYVVTEGQVFTGLVLVSKANIVDFWRRKAFFQSSFNIYIFR